MEYIEIDKTQIPYAFDIEIESDVFTFDVRYNERHDFFTIDLLKDDELIVAGEKIVYGVPLFERSYDPKTHPVVTIMPMDLSNKETRVTYGNLNETVFLYILDGSELDE